MPGQFLTEAERERLRRFPAEIPPADVIASFTLSPADLVDVRPDVLPAYGQRAHTRRDHLRAIQAYLGFREAGPGDLRALAEWLVERALEHDRPSLLLRLACEHLHAAKIV